MRVLSLRVAWLTSLWPPARGDGNFLLPLRHEPTCRRPASTDTGNGSAFRLGRQRLGGRRRRSRRAAQRCRLGAVGLGAGDVAGGLPRVGAHLVVARVARLEADRLVVLGPGAVEIPGDAEHPAALPIG